MEAWWSQGSIQLRYYKITHSRAAIIHEENRQREGDKARTRHRSGEKKKNNNVVREMDGAMMKEINSSHAGSHQQSRCETRTPR